ncbi:hypothetical protein Hanom_Chr16g01499751 [Helianthus anomalus]
MTLTTCIILLKNKVVSLRTEQETTRLTKRTKARQATDLKHIYTKMNQKIRHKPEIVSNT